MQPEEDGEGGLGVALREAAKKAFVALRGCSYGRCDFRVDAEGMGSCFCCCS